MLLDRDGGEGGWGGGSCTVEGGVNEFSRILILKSLTISNNLRKQKRLWKKELNNCVFGSDIDQFLCTINQTRILRC